MINMALEKRLASVLKMINANHEGSSHSASAIKGAVRAEFINKYLNSVIPQGLRISTTGEIIDSQNNQTGELDIVIENGYFPNIPVVSDESSRLYFAEGVAAVIEVKSDLQRQWNEALSTGSKVSSITRNFKGALHLNDNGQNIIMLDSVFDNENLPKIRMSPRVKLLKKIPYFIVGYTGWSNMEIIQKKVNENRDVISGILQLDKGFFVGNDSFNNVSARDSMCLLAFINCIYESYGYIKNPDANILSYGMND